MNFEALDGTKLILLMIAGAAFAAVGLYLMVRPKAGDAAKIEIFGLKFESSSAGLLVFLVGATFMSLPLFVKEELAITAPIPGLEEDPPSRVEPDIKLEEVTPTTLAAESNDVLIDEVEPNDEQSAPNAFSLGQRVTGNVRNDSPDWFVMNVPREGVLGHQIKLKHLSGYEVRVEVYNAREEHKGWIGTNNGAKYLDISSDFPDRMYFKVHNRIGTSGYELAVVP